MDNLKFCHFLLPIASKSRNLNLLEASGPLVGFTVINPLTPNDNYSGRTAPLTSKRYILYTFSTNTGTEYFKHGIYSPFFLFKMQFVSKF